MNHLIKRTQEFIETCKGPEGVAKKIEYVKKELWVGYTAIKEVEELMVEIFDHPRVGRMPNLLILARTNNGKSSVLKRFAKKNLAYTEQTSGLVRAPVIGIVMPEGPTEILFLDSILRATSIGFKKTEPFREKLDQVFRVLDQLENKVILIDEIHHIGAGAPKQQRLLLNLMKNLSTMFSLSFIVAGTSEARNIFNADEQLKNRFRQFVLPVWKDDNDLEKLLYGFEALLPFEEPSGLAEISGFILNQTDRTIGDIYDLLKRASIVALKKGEKSISKSRLGNCGHRSPAELASERAQAI